MVTTRPPHAIAKYFNTIHAPKEASWQIQRWMRSIKKLPELSASKAFHPGSRENSPETSICNCCKDCCDTFGLWRNGTLPLTNSTYHLSIIDQKVCTGCGTCVEWCPTGAIALDDNELAIRDEAYCIGCGVCAKFCPEEAISLKEGFRKVYVPPPKQDSR